MPTDLRAHAEALIAAIDAADCGHSMRLTRLVDGEETYTVTVGDQTAELPGADESYEWIREVKAKRKADAILTAVAALHDEAARGMREAAASVAEHRCDDGEDNACCEDTAFCIQADVRAIDPASLREGV